MYDLVLLLIILVVVAATTAGVETDLLSYSFLVHSAVIKKKLMGIIMMMINLAAGMKITTVKNENNKKIDDGLATYLTNVQ